MKFCKDCKHARLPRLWIREEAECAHDNAIITVNVVTGDTCYQMCGRMRMEGGKCGVEASLFESKGNK